MSVDQSDWVKVIAGQVATERAEKGGLTAPQQEPYTSETQP